MPTISRQPVGAHRWRSENPVATVKEEVTAVQLTALLDTLVVGIDEQPSMDLPCRVHNAELWFAETPMEVEQAKALCLDCPVLTQCLSGAMDRQEPWGVWGGELFVGGEIVARKRPRGRPRKCEVVAA
jgi:WhiB family redox-sensing transcriptional regulator